MLSIFVSKMSVIFFKCKKTTPFRVLNHESRLLAIALDKASRNQYDESKESKDGDTCNNKKIADLIKS